MNSKCFSFLLIVMFIFLSMLTRDILIWGGGGKQKVAAIQLDDKKQNTTKAVIPPLV